MVLVEDADGFDIPMPIKECVVIDTDDYIMKPFDPKEMVARVRAVLRRYQVGQQNDTSVEKTKCAEFDGLTINLTN